MSFRIISLFFILSIFLILSFSGCIFRPQGEIDDLLNQAGDNRKEIKKTWEYFQAKGDSLELESLKFLLENMTLHSYSKIVLQDSNKVEIQFSIYDFEDYRSARNQLDSLTALHGDLNWSSKERDSDLETITAEFLIENIELARETWQKYPWSRNYSFSQFKEYILPYRGSSEPLDPWRSYFIKRFSSLPIPKKDIKDPLKVATVINDSLLKIFTFDPLYYLNPTDQGLFQMMRNEKGRCEDMTNLAIYALRANGVAVSSDYTPYWADSGNNHAWNVLILPDSSSVPFMGCEAEPGNYNLRKRIAKVYRKMFSRQPNPLLLSNIPKEDIPPWLGISNYLDVTDHYTEVSDIELELDPDLEKINDFAYLCVLNSGEWKPIQSGKIIAGKVKFKKMGVDLCFLPAFYQDDKIVPIDQPFILTDDKRLRHLNGNTRFIEQELISVTQKTVSKSTDNNRLTYLTNGKTYLLYYWDNDWILVDEIVADNGSLRVHNVPAERLYWLVEKDSRREERIFTYENNRQIWW